LIGILISEDVETVPGCKWVKLCKGREINNPSQNSSSNSDQNVQKSLLSNLQLELQAHLRQNNNEKILKEYKSTKDTVIGDEKEFYFMALIPLTAIKSTPKTSIGPDGLVLGSGRRGSYLGKALGLPMHDSRMRDRIIAMVRYSDRVGIKVRHCITHPLLDTSVLKASWW
jgi:hypothetical protein